LQLWWHVVEQWSGFGYIFPLYSSSCVLDSLVVVFTRYPPTKENVKWAKEIKCNQYKNYCCNLSPSLPLAPFIFSQKQIRWYSGMICVHNLPCYECQREHNMPSNMLHTPNTHNMSKTCITWTWLWWKDKGWNPNLMEQYH